MTPIERWVYNNARGLKSTKREVKAMQDVLNRGDGPGAYDKSTWIDSYKCKPLKFKLS